MYHPLVLAAGSLLDCDAPTVVDAAAATGFDGVGLRLSGPHAVADAAALRRRVDGLGVSIHDTEVVRVGTDTTDPVIMIECSAALGATAVLMVSDLHEQDDTIRRVTELTEICARNRLVLGLEYMSWTDPSKTLAAVDVARATGCRLVVDLLHHVRVGAGVGELDAIVAAGVLGWVQVCDAPLSPPPDGNLVHEARHGRLPPGRGELPLRELLERVPDGVVISVEVQSDALALTDHIERARLLHDSARELLGSL